MRDLLFQNQVAIIPQKLKKIIVIKKVIDSIGCCLTCRLFGNELRAFLFANGTDNLLHTQEYICLSNMFPFHLLTLLYAKYIFLSVMKCINQSINQSNFYITNIPGEVKLSGVTAEMSGQTDSGSMFQRDGTKEWKPLAPVLVLTLGANRLIPMFGLSDLDGSDGASIEWR